MARDLEPLNLTEQVNLVQRHIIFHTDGCGDPKLNLWQNPDSDLSELEPQSRPTKPNGPNSNTLILLVLVVCLANPHLKMCYRHILSNGRVLDDSITEPLRTDDETSRDNQGNQHIPNKRQKLQPSTSQSLTLIKLVINSKGRIAWEGCNSQELRLSKDKTSSFRNPNIFIC